MNEMQVFQSEEFGEARIVRHDGEPWFVAADVCKFFGVTNRNRLMQQLDEDEKGGTQIDTPGGKQEMTIVSEAGLYTLLFYMRPEKARGVPDEYIERRISQLRSYKRWITHEVLPRIRRYGVYVSDAAISEPDVVSALAATIKRMKEDNERLQQQLNWARSGAGKREAKPDKAAALPDKACEEFVNGVWDMVERGKARVIELPVAEYCDDEDMIGFTDDNYLYIMPQRAYERITLQCREAGQVFPVTKRTLFKHLRSNGCVVGDSNGKTARVKQVGGRIMRLLWLPKKSANGGEESR